MEGTDGIDTDDDAGTVDAPCAPNCPDLDWVTFPGGTFLMGSAEGIGDSNERPQHEVTVQTFKMSKTEVTVTQYHVCAEAGICDERSIGGESYNFLGEWYNWSQPGRENHPVNGVNWFQAKAFAEWIGARLPSEAEWEYAARDGGQNIFFPWGDETASCEHATISYDESERCGNETTAEVCSKPLGNTATGLCDMVGSVWEWVEDDWHSDYNGAPSDGQAWIDSSRNDNDAFSEHQANYPLEGYRPMRGGSWYNSSSRCRSVVRSRGDSSVHNEGIGFRVVLDSK
jgi:formylglycine-generating enzyme required for sulfatase activity